MVIAIVIQLNVINAISVLNSMKVRIRVSLTEYAETANIWMIPELVNSAKLIVKKKIF